MNQQSYTDIVQVVQQALRHEYEHRIQHLETALHALAMATVHGEPYERGRAAIVALAKAQAGCPSCGQTPYFHNPEGISCEKRR